MRAVEWILSWLFPRKCVLCGKILKEAETDLCHRCRMETPIYPQTKRKLQFLDSFTAVWYYKGYVRRSLLAFKFRNARSYASVYGRFLAMKVLQEYPEGFDVLTWVPVSRWRKFCRGYDQVELLAIAVGQELGITPLSTLKKVRNNKPQSHITGAAKRRANVLGVYRAVCPEAVQGKRILLLDDILTTGATAGECARVLLTAGGAQVHCAAVAAAQNK